MVFYNLLCILVELLKSLRYYNIPWKHNMKQCNAYVGIRLLIIVGINPLKIVFNFSMKPVNEMILGKAQS